ncbi:MAG: NAD(P)/FAD-dependent oxidoreductase [Candidatus Dormibacteria bacterium]
MIDTVKSELPDTEGNLATPSVVICGAGPAGLTAALELAKHGTPCRVLEQDPQYVGGIARTVEYRGYRFDIGGHRFFSKNEEIENLWTQILGTEMLTRDRLSRIFYKGRFFDYPIRATNALRNLGPWEAVLCGLSYLRAKLRPHPQPRSFEDWVTNQFGARLFRIFFKTYTEKVWGMSTTELSADWAAQRIKGLSLWMVFTTALPWHRAPRSRGEITKTLIDHFRYPRLGPGQCWELAAQALAARGFPVAMGERVVSIRHRDGRACAVVTRSPEGEQRIWPTAAVISSLPLRELVEVIDPPPPPAIQAAGRGLRYRDFLTVALIVTRDELFPDNWIYIHDSAVKVGRIQNFKNWSPDMVPTSEYTCVGMEYFCFEGDGLWNLDDGSLITLAARELAHLGFCAADEAVDGTVVRQAKAYPVYDAQYQVHVDTIRQWLEVTIPTLWCVGRNGMHKYNNQDHSMMTALIAARRILGLTIQDPWNVNADAEYHEESHGHADGGGRYVPTPMPVTAIPPV